MILLHVAYKCKHLSTIKPFFASYVIMIHIYKKICWLDSAQISVRNSVYQNSVLGPTIFTVHIDDKCLKVMVVWS